MKSIGISNFKGIDDLPDTALPLEREGEPLNILIYGENGAGKSSLAEAITLAKFYDNMEAKAIRANIVGAERTTSIDAWLAEYMKDKSQPGFRISIDGHIFDSSSTRTPVISEGVYILNRLMLNITGSIRIDDLINETNFSFRNSRTDILSNEFLSMVLDEVNICLRDEFREAIEISRSQGDPNLIAVKDLMVNEQRDRNIQTRFNEAKLNLIKVMLFLAFVKFDMAAGDLVVLDDIITSLDVGNRLILTDHILRDMKKGQLIVMTHSFGFFNLFCHHMAATNSMNRWTSCSLIQLSNGHSVVAYPMDSNKRKAKEFKNMLVKTPDVNSSDLPNKMRQHLELLLHEFAKVLVIGNHEEAKDIITKLESKPKNLYYCLRGTNNVNTIYDLVEEIRKLTYNSYKPNTVTGNLRRLFKEYDATNVAENIASVIRRVDSFQKIVLHPGSHSQVGPLRPATRKELSITSDLIEYLENIVYQPSTRYPNGI